MAKKIPAAESILRAQVKRLQRRVVILERALQPFADEATEWSARVSDGYHPGLTEPRHNVAYGKAVFTMRDLRRAHRLVGA